MFASRLVFACLACVCFVFTFGFVIPCVVAVVGVAADFGLV